MNVFQIFDRKHIVPLIVKENIMRLNPGCKYELYDFKDGKKFIKENYDDKLGEKIIKKMNSLNRIAHKSDLLRFCLLYKLGGVYLDIDLEPKVSFLRIIKEYDFCGMTGNIKTSTFKKNTLEHHPIIANGFLYTKKMNPFIRKEIEFILSIKDQSRHGVICYHMYNSLKSMKFSPYKEFKLNEFKIYFYRENFNKEKGSYSMNDINDKVLINSNLNNYPPNFEREKKKY